MTETNSLLNELRRLHDDRESGTLALSNDAERIEVFFQEGMIAAVSSNLDLYRLGHYLVKEGWLQAGDLAPLVLESRRQNMLFGETAIWRKFLDCTDLAELVRRQAIDLLKYVLTNGFSVDAFTVGLRSFYVPAKVNFGHLLLELARSDPDPFEPEEGRTIALSSTRDLTHYPFYPEELNVLGELRQPKTFSTLLASLRMSESSLKRILSVFNTLGLLEMSSTSPQDVQKELTKWSDAIIKRASFPFELLVPLVTHAVSNEKLQVRQNPSCFISDQFKNLKVGISQSDFEPPVKVLAVSSPESQEGKSLISANLAFAFSMDPGRRVIVVDCDFRNPSLDKYLGVPLEPGLLGFLTKSHLGPHCFMRRLDNLFFLTTGGTAASPIELLSMEKMKELITYLRADFDTIILDSPPFSPIADGRVVSALSDGLILVVRRGKTSYGSLEKAFKLVDRTKLLGVVFNGVTPVLFNTYYDYRYYRKSQDNGYSDANHRKIRTLPKKYLES